MLKWTGVHDKGGIILSKNKKIVNYKKPFSLNIGVVIFVIIFIYILFNIFSYFTKTRISVYEVEQGTIAENNTYNGLALRSENVVYADTAGYVNYYLKDVRKASYNTLVYSIDESGDIANGPGVRVSLFVSGCTHHCKGCFNEETWSFEYGKPFTEETEEQILKLLEPSYISGLTVLGGEPMEYMNQEVLFPFLKKVKERFPEKSIWCFTGYVYEKDILHRMIPKWKYTKKMLEQIDYLVDGPFVMEKKNISLKFRGSSNQRIIDVKKTLETGEVVLWEEQ